MNINELKNNVKEAEVLLEEARAEYHKSIIEAVEKGEMVPVVRSSWRTFVTKEGNRKVYCEECGAFNSDRQVAFCPHCGAAMSNADASYSFKDRIVPAAASVEVKISQVAQPAQPAFVTPSTKEMIQKILDSGMTQSKLCKLGGFPTSTLFNWVSGKSEPRMSNKLKLISLYRDVCRV